MAARNNSESISWVILPARQSFYVAKALDYMRARGTHKNLICEFL